MCSLMRRYSLPRRFSDLRRPGGHAERQLLVDASPVVGPFDEHEILAPGDQHRIRYSGEAACEAQAVYGVEQVAFAHAVVAEESVDFRRKIEAGMPYVLEIVDFEAS